MKSAHKLEAALAIFILLSVAAYFIITGLQDAASGPPQALEPQRTTYTNTSITSQEKVAASLAPTSSSTSINGTTEPQQSTASSSIARLSGSDSTPSGTPTDQSSNTLTTAAATTTTTSAPPETTTPTITSITTIATTSSDDNVSPTTVSPSTASQSTVETTTESSTKPTKGLTEDTQEPEEQLISTDKIYEEATRRPQTPVDLTPEELDSWLQFKSHYRKSYASPMDEESHKLTFIGNLRFINAFNLRSNASFTLGVNHFGDLTRDEINNKFIGRRHTWSQQGPSMRILPDSDPAGSQLSGSAADWRHLMTEVGPPDQGMCLDSGVFALVANLEATLNAAGSNKTKLSEQQLIECLGLHQAALAQSSGTPVPGVCQGQLSLADILSILESSPIKLSTFHEYIQFKQMVSAGREPVNVCAPPPAQQPDTRPYLSAHVTVTRDNIDEALQNIGPLVVAIDASQPTFHFYKSGVYHELQCSMDAHNYYALLLTHSPAANTDTFPDAPQQQQQAYYTIRASLGPDWGELGHMRLAKDPQKNKCLPQELAVYPNIAFE